MKFLDLVFPFRNQPSQTPQVDYERLFAPAPPRLFSSPILGTMGVKEGSPPLVKFAGTLWRFRVCRAELHTFVDGQVVKILGRQGNRLLIEPEMKHD
jgi:hypothetical protein